MICRCVRPPHLDDLFGSPLRLRFLSILAWNGLCGEESRTLSLVLAHIAGSIDAGRGGVALLGGYEALPGRRCGYGDLSRCLTG
jgi:hypothetical protein